MILEILLSLAFFGLVCWAVTRADAWVDADGREHLSSRALAAAGAALFLAAFLLRVVISVKSEGFSPDMSTFKAWGYSLVRTPLQEIYHQEDYFLDYPPGYLYILMLLERLRGAFDLGFDSGLYTLLLKLPSLLADMACAGVLLWVGRRKLGDRSGLLLAGLYLFCPVVLANSAQWGQVDSFTTAIFLASICLLYREWYIPSAVLYGVSIACKPQTLIFAPVFIFFALKQRKPLKLLLCVGITFLPVLFLAAPFTKGWDFLWLLDRYRATMDYYHYYSINAYNCWTLIGFNWRDLPEGFAQTLLTVAAPILATAACGLFYWKAKRPGALFAAPVVVMTVMYLLGVKMHERYLYPIFLFLLLAYAFTPDRRLLGAFGLAGLAHHFNVAHVLWLFREKGGNYDPNEWTTRVMAGAQVAALGLTLWTLWTVFVRESDPKPLPVRKPRPEKTPAAAPAPMEARRFRLVDWIAMGGVTLLYACVAFWNLGSPVTANTAWTPAQGESVLLTAAEPCDTLVYLPGIAPDDSHYTSRVGMNVQWEVSDDMEVWSDLGVLGDQGNYVYAWYQVRTKDPFRYVRLTPLDGSVTLNEIALKVQGRTAYSEISATVGGDALIDEQEKVPLTFTYENSTYFDEIYHARTAYENILRLEPYENTHPPLGKFIISAGIALFGMNPFGWRFMGTLFGVLMLPVLYHLLWQLFGKPWTCLLGTALFAVDFMHFTQTRIATIDTYAVFFLLLMYDAMTVFLRRDVMGDGWKKLLPPLLVCGVFTGLGLAAKWNVAYGAVGLAVLYFGKLFLTGRDLKRAGQDLKAFWRKAGMLCAWCCLFFLAIPFGLYFLAFLPLTTLPHNVSRVWDAFISYQVNMYNYHANLVATHTYASPWYEWPLDLRPICYYVNSSAGELSQYSSLFSFGNPLLWWAGLPALGAAVWLWIKERRAWAAVTVTAYVSILLPWVLVSRLTFIYHYFPAVPFLAVALAGAFHRFGESRLGGRKLGPFSLSQWLGGAFLLGCGALFVLFFPVISGAGTERAYSLSLGWLPNWIF